MDLSVSVVILSQPDEVAVTALTLHHLVRDLDTATRIHVLMNGGSATELEMMAPDSSMILYHSAPSNLGVARGRNALLRLPEVRAADVIVILDNDVITPPGHIERLVSALDADPEAGIIGPAIRYFPAVAPALGLVADHDLRAPVTNENLVHLGPYFRDEASWFHLGTPPDWRAVYIDEIELERRLVRRMGGVMKPFFPMNHQDPRIREAVSRGSTDPIAASNVAGCCQVFRRELLDEVGYLVDEFSPYGFEDVEFCIRVAQSGRKNYIHPGILMLHGTDERHSVRRSVAGRVATQRNFMRCKTLLAWCRTRPTWESSVEQAILRRYLLTRHSGNQARATKYLRAHIAGSADALRQIHHSDVLRDDAYSL